jgi:glutathione S-transferase
MALTLYVFTLSHYCEKVRWALALRQLPYRSVALLPGAHLFALRHLSPTRQVPLLVDGTTVVEGSAAILDHLESIQPVHLLTPAAEFRHEIQDWERYLDGELGPAARRVAYFHVLQRPAMFTGLCVQGGPWWGKYFCKLAAPALIRSIRRKLAITEQNVEQDSARLAAVFQRTDQRLARARFLVGDHFSRADLVLAALAAPLIWPAEHPLDWPDAKHVSDALRAQLVPFRQSATGQYVLEQYRTRRWVGRGG